MDNTEQAIRLKERVEVLEDCVEVVRKRKRSVQEQLQKAHRDVDAFTRHAQETSERRAQHMTTQERQATLQKELQSNLSKSRERLVSTLLEGFKTVLLAVDGNNDENDTTSVNNNGDENDIHTSGSSNNIDRKEALQMIVNASVQEVLSMNSLVDAHERARQRRKSFRGTCLDWLQTMSTTKRTTLPSTVNATPVEEETKPLAVTASRSFDPDLELCPYELGGKCSDPYCSFQHLSESKGILPRELLPLPALNLPTFPKDHDEDPAQMQQPNTEEGMDDPPPKTADGTNNTNEALSSSTLSDADDGKDEVGVEPPPPQSDPSVASAEKSTDGDGDDDDDSSSSSSARNDEVAATADPPQTPLLPLQTFLSLKYGGRVFLSSMSQGGNRVRFIPASAAAGSPTNRTARSQQQVLDCVRLSIHGGQLPMPQTAKECFQIAYTAIESARLLGGGEKDSDLLGCCVEQNWQKGFQHGNCKDRNLFSLAFRVQRLLSTSILEDQRTPSDAGRRPDSSLSSFEATPLRDLVDTLLPEQIAGIHRQLHENRNRKHSFPNATATIAFGESFLAALTHAANIWSDHKMAAGASKTDLVDLFKLLDTTIADLISECMKNTDEDDNVTMQLILAPICAAHLSLSCFLQKYDVIQIRSTWLFHMHVSSSDKQTSTNVFLYSELLWSQLVQLRVCLPFVPAVPDGGNEIHDTVALQQQLEDEEAKAQRVVVECLASTGVTIRNLVPPTGLHAGISPKQPGSS